MSVYIINFLQALKKFLIMIGPNHCICATIEESNVIDTIYLGELEIDVVSTFHCGAYSM